MRRLACALAVGMVMPPGEATALRDLRAGAFWQRLTELDLVPDLEQHRLGQRQLGHVLQLASAIRAEHLQQLMTGQGTVASEPLVIAQWHAQDLPEAEQRLRWQQLWQCLNLLLPLRGLWVGSAEMPGLATLQDCPGLKPQVSDLSASWLEILDLSATEVQDWVMALAKLGVVPPEVGYELLNAGGRVLAEAELAWPGQQTAVLLPGSETEAHAFTSQGWRIYLADGSPLPAELKSLLMENMR